MYVHIYDIVSYMVIYSVYTVHVLVYMSCDTDYLFLSLYI